MPAGSETQPGKFDWITRDAINAAIGRIASKGEISPQGRSIHFDVIMDGKAFPPKPPRLTAQDFSGGYSEANRVLRERGFDLRDRRRNFLQ